MASALGRLGWARDVTSVRLTVASATGAVSFTLDLGGGLRVPSADPLTPAVMNGSERVGDQASVAPDRMTVGIACIDLDFRRRLERDFASETGVRVLDFGDCDDVGLADSMRARRPDVLLLDQRLFDGLDEGSRQFLREYAARYPVLLLLDDVGPETVRDILRNRFHGYLSLHCPGETCLRAIRAVRSGEFWLPRSLLAKALEQWLARERGADLSTPVPDGVVRSFTGREQEVLALLKQGLSNKQIARELGVMEDTVKKHLQKVYDKLGVRRRTLVLVSESRA